MKNTLLFLTIIFLLTGAAAQSRIVHCDFSWLPDGDVFTNCTGVEATGCDKNPYYKNSLRFLHSARYCFCNISGLFSVYLMRNYYQLYLA